MKCKLTHDPALTDENGWPANICQRCGRVIHSPHHPSLWRGDDVLCYAWPFWHELGHWLSLLLAAVGLNPRRYVWLKTKLGLHPKCGCGQREAALNTWGDKARRWLLLVLP